MVETVSDFMLFPFSARATARNSSAQFSSSSSSCNNSSSRAFPFGSCNEGWYYRCIEMLLSKPKKNSPKGSSSSSNSSRLLVTVNVLGSAGPLRFIVNEETLVATVIDTALKSYAREGRLPLLGSDFNSFLLYSAFAGSDALSPWDMIGQQGGRNFVLCKKQQLIGSQTEMIERKTTRRTTTTSVITRKGNGGSWKAWINKSLVSFKISSH